MPPSGGSVEILRDSCNAARPRANNLLWTEIGLWGQTAPPLENPMCQRSNSGQPRAGPCECPECELARQHLRDAVESRYRQLYALAANCVRRRVQQGIDVRMEVEDVLHEAVVQALSMTARFDLAHAREECPVLAAAAWLVGIIRRIAHSPTQRLLPVRPDPRNSEVWKIIDVLNGEEREGIRKAFERLPPLYRDAIQARYFDGLDGQALAEALRCGPGAARARVCRALKLLRDLYRREEGGAS